jgi:uncharacterized membrane protein YgdD (TMEM256/DUF423 family)
MSQTFLIIGALSGALAVAYGAFGAHALRSRVEPERLETFETGVRYQMYHTLALLVAALLPNQAANGTWLAISRWSFLVGMLLFSGSLYIFVLTRRRAWAAITPVGGLVLILGWVGMAVALLAI